MVITFQKKSSLHSHCRNCCAPKKQTIKKLFLGSSSGVGDAILFLECNNSLVADLLAEGCGALLVEVLLVADFSAEGCGALLVEVLLVLS